MSETDETTYFDPPAVIYRVEYENSYGIWTDAEGDFVKTSVQAFYVSYDDAVEAAQRLVADNLIHARVRREVVS